MCEGKESFTDFIVRPDEGNFKLNAALKNTLSHKTKNTAGPEARN
jgi:hypothetical protein